MKLIGKSTVEGEKEGVRNKLHLSSTEREDIYPLLGMDWPREFEWMMQTIGSATDTTDQSEKDWTIINFEKLFKGNRKIKDTENEIRLKPGHPPIKQKSRPIPYHLQSYVGNIKKLIKSRLLEKKQKTKRTRRLFHITACKHREKTSE